MMAGRDATFLALVLCSAMAGCRTPAPSPMVRAWSSSTPPDLSSHTLVEEDPGTPVAPELGPYVGRRPLVRIVQTGNPSRQPAAASFDLVVFDDGRVFFEGQRCAATLGLATSSLSAAQLSSLSALLEKECPTGPLWGMPVPGPTASVAIFCFPRSLKVETDEGVARVVETNCDVIDRDLRPSDDDVARAAEMEASVIAKVGASQWIGQVTDPRCALTERHAPGEIEKAVVPVTVKRYVP